MCTVLIQKDRSAGYRTALVIGASGAVGTRLTPALAALGFSVLRAGRSARNDVIIDLAAPHSAADYIAATATADVVINVSGVENPELAAQSASPFVDISASASYFAAVKAMNPRAGALLSVGLAPGLSSLLIDALPHESGDELDLGIVLGVGEQHGVAAIEWTAQLLGTRFDSPADRRRVLNFAEPRRFDVPGLGRTVLSRADFPDGGDGSPGGQLVRSYFGTTSPAANVAMMAATRLPTLGRRMVSLHLPGSSAWFLVARNRRTGEQQSAGGHEQSLATATVTAIAAELAAGTGWSGVRHLPELLTRDRLRSRLADIAIPTGIASL